MTPCAGILLAGGESRRMGRDKALLPFGDAPVGARLYHLLATTCSEVVVVRPPELGFPVPGARLVGDRHPGRGPLEAIATGLEHVGAPRALVLACDMPFVGAEVVRFLQRQDPAAGLVVPRTERGLEPLLAVYARALLPRIRQLLASGERRLQALCADVPCVEVPSASLEGLDPAGRTFWNLNRPEEYAAALEAPETRLSGPGRGPGQRGNG